jgi:hypothetical protein
MHRVVNLWAGGHRCGAGLPQGPRVRVLFTDVREWHRSCDRGFSRRAALKQEINREQQC